MTTPTTAFVPTRTGYGYYSSSSFNGIVHEGSSIPATSTFITHALTTIFTAPSYCSERLFTVWRTNHQTMVGTRNYELDTGCYPPSWYGAIKGLNEVYSPGVCPAGWPSAATTVSHGVTTAACCPSGMTYLDTKYCGGYYSTTTTLALNANTNISVTTPFVGLDYHVLVAWASSDLANFTPSSAPVLTSSNAPTTTLPRLIPATAARTFSNPPSESIRYIFLPTTLGEGAKAGIGIGVVIWVLAVASAITFGILWRRERKKRRTQFATAKESPPPVPNKDGYPEIDGIPLAELDKTSIKRSESPLTEMPESIAAESLSSEPSEPSSPAHEPGEGILHETAVK